MDGFQGVFARAVAARLEMLDDRHKTAVRLFNGFLEGWPELVVDLYGKTAVLHSYLELPDSGVEVVTAVEEHLRTAFPWLQAIIVKARKGDEAAKRGQVVWGEATAVTTWIREEGVRYALDLLVNQDASFYLDTRGLRRWAQANLAGQTVLNTFAYTGSLGVAAMAGGASRVVHVDLNKRFLNVAKTSYTLNGFPIHKPDFQVGDFWPHMSRLKRAGEQFDCVFLDPPFFSTTAGGTVDLNQNPARLINKIRPLVRSGGQIVAINNALFVSGAEYMAALETLCQDGYVTVHGIIPVPPDCTGFPHTRVAPPITDPAPFNHATKIAILDITHKS